MFEIVRVMGQTEDVTGQDQGTVRRADARRNMAAILEAAARCLAQDPEASLADIAREAGVTLGKDYPEPIVDHDMARKLALAALQTLR